jgi:hypothetical protein
LPQERRAGKSIVPECKVLCSIQWWKSPVSGYPDAGIQSSGLSGHGYVIPLRSDIPQIKCFATIGIAINIVSEIIKPQEDGVDLCRQHRYVKPEVGLEVSKDAVREVKCCDQLLLPY